MPKRKRKECGGVSKQSARPHQHAVAAAPESPRKVLSDFNSLDKLIDTLRSSKRIIAVTGAGISVSCGIPDFRSENGIYDVVSRLDLGLSSPEDLFDLEFFLDDPKPFFMFAKALYPGKYTPSPTHRFLKLLETRGKLLRNFTQNVDGLEAQVGLKKFVACHGSFLTASCLSCKKKRKAEDIREEVMQQRVPRCPNCEGVIKPDITFFGEKLPHSVKRAVEADYRKADLLLVLGTSLKVAPVSRIIQFMPPHVPQVLVNRELIRPPRAVSDGFDLHLLGNCDDVIAHICTRLGWELPPVPQATTQDSSAGETRSEAGGDGRSSDEPATISPSGGVAEPQAAAPPPSFVPPNCYVFSPSTGGTGSIGDSGGTVRELLAGPEETSVAEDMEDSDFLEVITCDNCGKEVVGEVFECDQCFGFDLCGGCYNSGDNHHTDQTGHSFRWVHRVAVGGGLSTPSESDASPNR